MANLKHFEFQDLTRQKSLLDPIGAISCDYEKYKFIRIDTDWSANGMRKESTGRCFSGLRASFAIYLFLDSKSGASAHPESLYQKKERQSVRSHLGWFRFILAPSIASSKSSHSFGLSRSQWNEVPHLWQIPRVNCSTFSWSNPACILIYPKRDSYQHCFCHITPPCYCNSNSLL